jgi:hypothetical protein
MGMKSHIGWSVCVRRSGGGCPEEGTMNEDFLKVVWRKVKLLSKHSSERYPTYIELEIVSRSRI